MQTPTPTTLPTPTALSPSKVCEALAFNPMAVVTAIVRARRERVTERRFNAAMAIHNRLVEAYAACLQAPTWDQAHFAAVARALDVSWSRVAAIAAG
jgi:hypothetical protein